VELQLQDGHQALDELRTGLDIAVKAHEAISKRLETTLQGLATEMATKIRLTDKLGHQLRTIQEDLAVAKVGFEQTTPELETARKQSKEQLAAATIQEEAICEERA
jgi:hypothetical protein